MEKKALTTNGHWETNPETGHHFYVRLRWAYPMQPRIDIFGWVIKDPQNNIYYAGYPKPYDPATDSDAVDLGPFPSLDQAKKAVIKANPIPKGHFV